MKDDQNLYRFIPLHELIDICESPGKLVLKSPRLWDDNYEGYFYKKLMSEKSMIDMFINIRSHIKDEDLDLNAKGDVISMRINLTTADQKAILSMLRFSAVYYLIFCMSWSKKSESDALWRIYSYDNKAIRISTKVEYFKRLKKIFFSEVKYQSKFDFSKIVNDVLYRDINSENIALKHFKPFYVKRIEFNHEKEVRMFYFHKLRNVLFLNLFKSNNHTTDDFNYIKDNLYKCIDINGNLIISEYKTLLKIYLAPFLSESIVEFDLEKENLKPKDIIDDVMIHPLAPEYFVKIVKKYCTRYGLEFLGKSNLYEFE